MVFEIWDSCLVKGLIYGIDVSHMIVVVVGMQVMNKFAGVTPIGQAAPSCYLFVRGERCRDGGVGGILPASLNDRYFPYRWWIIQYALLTA